MEMVSYSPEELDYVLGYSARGRMTRQILRGRQPSRPYAEKFGRLEAEPPPPKPEWLPQAPKVLTGEAIPAFMVETGRSAATPLSRSSKTGGAQTVSKGLAQKAKMVSQV
jgi:hypothetical protein